MELFDRLVKRICLSKARLRLTCDLYYDILKDDLKSLACMNHRRILWDSQFEIAATDSKSLLNPSRRQITVKISCVDGDFANAVNVMAVCLPAERDEKI